ncbi:MAG: DUF5069 domain-containing protein [Nitrospirota bacterium]
MKVKVLDLTKEFPRSPKEKLGGHVHLARMIDKARANTNLPSFGYLEKAG